MIVSRELTLVTGLSCDQCAVGYYQSISDSDECSPCDCNGRALTDPPQCDHLTGACQNCRPGTTGLHCESCAPHVVNDSQCETCEPGYWGLDQDGCRGLCFSCSVYCTTCIYTVSQKKGPTCKLSVTLSNLNRFSKFLH